MIRSFYHKRQSKNKLADFLADNPTSKAIRMYEELPDKVVEVFTTQAALDNQVWELYFDCALRTGPKGNPIANGGCACIPSEICASTRILIIRAMH